MNKSISYILCTLNPDLVLFAEVLASIRCQEKYDDSEVIIVDNGSDIPVGSGNSLNIDCQTRIFRELQPGLTAARLRGYAESKSEILVFVDDDNVLDPSYSKNLLLLVGQFPSIGVFSAGKILPRYGATPPEEIKTYWPYMALIDLKSDVWANIPSLNVLPMGAGMVVRATVMQAYENTLLGDHFRRSTDRTRDSLAAGGDTDIGIVACRSGYGCGYFIDLRLTHVMPAQRLNTDYLKRLVASVSHSTTSICLHSGVHAVSWKTIATQLFRTTYSMVFKRGKVNRAARIASWARLRAYLLFGQKMWKQ